MLNFPNAPISPGQLFPVPATAGYPQYWWDNNKRVWQRYKKIPYFFDDAPLILFPSSVDSGAIVNIAWDGIALPSWVLLKNDVTAATSTEVPIVFQGTPARGVACVNVGDFVDDTLISFSIAETVNDPPVATSNVCLVNGSNVGSGPSMYVSSPSVIQGQPITISWDAYPRTPGTNPALDLLSIVTVTVVPGYGSGTITELRSTTVANSYVFTTPIYVGHTDPVSFRAELSQRVYSWSQPSIIDTIDFTVTSA